MPSRVALAALLALGITVRLLAHRFAPNLINPDEVFQVLEPAHRLALGTGVTTWEFVVGIRSWLLPGIAAGLMALGHLFGDDPATIAAPVVLFMTLCSMAPVVCGYLWGHRFGGPPGAIAAGALNALWVDLVYFSTHTLTEVVAGDCLVVALYLAYPGVPVTSGRRLFRAGLAFGLVLAFRFHLAPTLALAFAWIGRGDLRARWLPLAAGALVPVLLGGLLDALTWSYPFQSVWLNFRLNVVEGVGASFGTSPWYAVLAYQATLWGGATALILTAALWGGSRLPLLLVAAAAIVATHSAIAHKEYRFVYPALPLVTALAGVATADAIEAIRRAWRPAGPRLLVPLAVAFWGATSLAVALSPPYRAAFTQWGGAIEAFRSASRQRGLCGVGLLGLPWWRTPGQTSLPPRVPLYAAAGERFAEQSAAFDVVITPEPEPVPDPRFTRRACFANGRDDHLEPLDAVCVWRRPGDCTPGAAPPPPVEWPGPLADRGKGAREDAGAAR